MSQLNKQPLLIRLPASDTDPVFWYQSETDNGQLAVSELGSLSESRDVSRVIVFVPGELVNLTSVEVNGSMTPAVIRSLPYRLEDDLGSDVESVHLAVLGREGDQVHLAIVENSWMDIWSKWLGDAGIASQQWLPETLTIDWLPGQLALMERDSSSHMVRYGQWQGAVCDDDWLPIYLDSINPEQSLEQLELASSEFFSRAAAMLPLKANLLQGSWQPAKIQSDLSRSWQQLRLSAVLTLLIALVWGGSTLFNRWQADREAESYQQASRALFANTFPGKRAIRPLSQMKTALKQLRENTDRETGFLLQLDELAPSFKSQSSVTPVAMSYQRNLQQLRIVAEAQRISQFTDLRDRLSSSGTVRLESLDEQTGDNRKATVTGVLIISGDRS